MRASIQGQPTLRDTPVQTVAQMKRAKSQMRNYKKNPNYELSIMNYAFFNYLIIHYQFPSFLPGFHNYYRQYK